MSRITTYLRCPRKFRLRYLDRLEPESRSASMALGTVVHSGLGWWWAERRAGRTPLLTDLSRIVRSDVTAETISGALEPAEDVPDLVPRAVELLDALVMAVGEAVPAEVEHRFEVELPGADVALLGFVDFMDREQNRIGELKTTSRKSGPSEWELQLAAYSWAYGIEFGERPRVQLVQVVKTKTPRVEVTEFEMTDRQERWFLEVASEAWRSIQAGAFHPRPTWMCATCEYRTACRSMGERRMAA